MNNSQEVYDIQESINPEEGVIRYYFVSKGRKAIIKVVEYQYVKQFNNKPLFNLGFGDYNPETGNISDEDMSGNEDHYQVFNTVLHTIPQLFTTYVNSALTVKGSDSGPEFIESCKRNCIRKCKNGHCKKADRRINIYRSFVDKYYEILSQEYSFHGGEELSDDSHSEPYEKGKKYKQVIVEKKLN